MLVSTSAAAVEMTLCPLGYSGNGGVCSSGRHSSSTHWLIIVSGRITPERNFSSHAAMKASASAMAVRAYDALLFRAACAAMPIQCPPGEIFFVANMVCPCTFIV